MTVWTVVGIGVAVAIAIALFMWVSSMNKPAGTYGKTEGAAAPEPAAP